MLSSYRIAIRGCQHLGYAVDDLTRRHQGTGWNQRIIDGHVAHRLTMESILETGVNGIVDGGDLFHWSHPRPRDIEHALRVDDLRADVTDRPWLVVNTGNHDAGSATAISAAAVLHRPALQAHVVFSDRHHTGPGPHPGHYEIHTPVAGAPVRLHLVSHDGLAGTSHGDASGADIAPWPVDDDGVDILFAHGILGADPRLRQLAERHGAERLIPDEWPKRAWAAVVLSDFHTLGRIPSFPATVWYTGSAVRRGFADDAGPRGWVQADVADDGTVTLTPRHSWQRPQHDFPVIDAGGLTVAEIDDLVTARLQAGPWHDDETERLTGDGGYLLRQLITNTSVEQREGIATLRGEWLRLAAGALQWTVQFPERRGIAAHTTRGRASLTHRVDDLGEELRKRSRTGRVGQVLDVAPPAMREPVLDTALDLLATDD